MHVLPWDNHEKVEKEPPYQQQCEVKRVDPKGAILLLNAIELARE